MLYMISMSLETINILGLEVFSSGKWNNDDYSEEDLDKMIEAFDKVGFEPTVKAGHAYGQDKLAEEKARELFGAPALGYVEKIYRKGKKLFADLKRVPKKFAELIHAGSYNRVSSEIYWDYEHEDKVFPRVLKSVAFLGADIPAITSLKAIENLFHKQNETLCAYDENNKEYRIYFYGEPNFLKDKNSVNYRQVTPKAKERCGNCRFFSYYNTCNLVEGTVESDWLCDLWEALPKYAQEEKEYVITKEGDEYVLRSKDGKKILGKHKTRKGAEDQEKAINISKHTSETETSIKENNKTEEKEMDEKERKELEEKLATLQAEVEAKDNERKELEDALTKEKEDKVSLNQRIDSLEKETKDLQKQAETQRRSIREKDVDNWVYTMKQSGRLLPREEKIVKALMLFLPDEAVHKYSDGENDVEEAVNNSFKKLFETRESILNEVSRQDPEETGDKKYANASEELQDKAEKYMKENKEDKVSLADAYNYVLRTDKELAKKYNRGQ